jgi:hypothetical protein
MASVQADLAAKEFKTPTNGKAGVYIFRNSFFGAGVKMGISADEQFIGLTAFQTYHYIELTPGNHTFKVMRKFTKETMWDSIIQVNIKAGKLYYIRQEMGNKLQLVSEEEGQRGVNASRLALSHPFAATD